MPLRVPLARADDGACVSSGIDPATCDQGYLTTLARAGIHPVPENGIAVGHRIADTLTKDPTMHGITYVVNKVINDSAAGRCNPAGGPCHGPMTITMDQAVAIVHAAVHYYGPPGLEETLNAL